ncbi:Aminopeptidase Y [Wickerhamiella sorbophila]|uniref:Peptide hydrolase n=1 Tax=Wickerhamiella sorbophila TaxID=45607 RepID=A0A2T0FPW3_9ASCO|nr:Aminopeptidase Y [Wickerhamiella sorbophila]PRT57020.1 Aminopeptidase Y [Wickerhamiella sorbophila]
MMILLWAVLAGANAASIMGWSGDQTPITPFEKPLISSEGILELINEDDLKDYANKFYSAAEKSVPTHGHPTRVIGSAGHNATIQLITDTLEELEGFYKVSTQPFLAIGGRVHNYSVVDDDKVVPSRPVRLTPATDGPVSAPIFKVQGYGCINRDFDGAEGAIALVPRGKCAFGAKSEFAGLANAKALLIYDPEQVDDGLVSGDLGTPLEHQIPSLIVDLDWAKSVAEGTQVTVEVDSEIYNQMTFNIIAESVDGDHDNVVMLGAHSDSVEAGPGSNDNGSGAIAQLNVARALSHFKLKNAVRFAWWAAEEEGLLGSLYYTDNLPISESKKIRLFMDYDMMASTNYIYEIYNSNNEDNPLGSSELREMYVDFFSKEGHNSKLQPFDGRSDYVGFLELGIPSSGFDSGVEEIKTEDDVENFGGEAGIAYDTCYHQACDNLDNLNYEPWLVNTRAIAHSVAVYASSLEGFPERDVSALYYGKPHLRPNYFI